ncbi:hypothetical protein HPP92_001254 [Vanilla planifolia]|uniref:Uncharacterized protein n=1 Tax=Vanilla planifolia TaxID=51239 RepID=A0A835SCL7_VANPL|nr:hypothetical protein HPP92_001254 [Vanilla planifolia]
MLIGYFSLSDWSLKGTMKEDEQWTSSNDEFYGSSGFGAQIIYKFEILESIVIFPVEDHLAFCLQVDAPWLYCSFMLASTSENAFEGISLECNVPSITFASGLNIFNLFGRSLSLSLLLLKDGTSLFKLGYNICKKNIHFVEHLDTDVWLRVPCKIKKSVDDSDFPALIMINVDNCKVTVEDEYFFDGVGAIMSVVDQLSLVSKVSEYFTSDVLHFLHLKRKINEEAVDITDRPNEFSFILKACAKALSFNFSRSNVKEASTVETIANLYVRLDCSASVRNGLLKSLDAEVSSFLLHSFCNDVLLASFTSDDGATFRIGINFCRSLQGSAEVVFAIPAIDIWLHIPEWVSINAFLCSLKESWTFCSHQQL